MTYADKLERADRLLDPAEPVTLADRRVRALSPHVGAVLALAGQPALVWRAAPVDAQLEPGAVVRDGAAAPLRLRRRRALARGRPAARQARPAGGGAPARRPSRAWPGDASRRVTDARTVALRVVRRVDEGSAYADRALDAESTRAGLEPRERALASHLALGTITWQRLLDHVVAAVAGREPARLDPVSRAVVRLGAFQLLRSDRIPPHAAVATSVALVRRGGNPAAAGLVNALLRRVADGGAAASPRCPTPPRARRRCGDRIPTGSRSSGGPPTAPTTRARCSTPATSRRRSRGA